MSEQVLVSPQGLEHASDRNIWKQKSILDGANVFHELLQEMPPGEKPATGGAEDMHTIKCLLNMRRGELREWSGRWEPQEGPMPTKHIAPGMWQSQFFPPHADEVAAGAISTVLGRPASGGEGHFVRVATVLGLADLFYDLGQAHTAAELYDYYLQLRIFAHVRSSTRPKSREGRQVAPWQRS